MGSKILKISGVKPHPERVDITKKEIFTYIQRFNPDVIIHCAAFTNVDKCETDKMKAYDVNVTGTENVARASQEVGAQLIYISTDFVFDGKKGMYTEEDQPNPLNYYGFTKLEGERKAREICSDYLIVRTSVLYGWHQTLNFVTWVYYQLKDRNPIKVVTDQYTCPTCADNLADVLLEMAEKKVQGLYHVTGAERINRHDFAVKIAHKFSLDETLIIPILSEELNQKAERPKDSSLSTEKVKSVITTRLMTVDEGLCRM